jgi:hypothetical protein
MLGETFNDLVSPTSHEGFDVCFLFFPLNVNAKPLRRAMHKGKWALDHRPTQS